MDGYEELEQEAEDEMIGVHHEYMPHNIRGLYSRRGAYKAICVSPELSYAERRCVLAEELGHHHTRVENQHCVDSDDYAKHERKALKWSVDRLLPLDAIGDAFIGCGGNGYEMAEMMDVPLSFLEEAIASYGRQFGVAGQTAKYRFIFCPNFNVSMV